MTSALTLSRGDLRHDLLTALLRAQPDTCGEGDRPTLRGVQAPRDEPPFRPVERAAKHRRPVFEELTLEAMLGDCSFRPIERRQDKSASCGVRFHPKDFAISDVSPG